MNFEIFLAQGQLFSGAHYWILLCSGLFFGLYMAWSIGANDVANAMGTSVGSRALTLKQAIIVAGVLEFGGAFLVGPHVSETIRKEIIPFSEIARLADGAQLYVFGMLAALLASGTWLMAATYFGLPVSTTHTIVGAVLGFGLVVFWGNWELVNWKTVGTIAASWVVSPLFSGFFAFLVFTVIQRSIFYKTDMAAAARRVAPFLVFAVFEVIILVTFWKGLKHLRLELSAPKALLYATLSSTCLAVLSIFLLRRLAPPQPAADTANAAQNPVIADDLAKVKQRLRRMSGDDLGRLERRLGRMSGVARGDVQDELEGLRSEIEEAQSQLQDRLKTLADRAEAIETQVLEANGALVGQWGTPEMRATERIFGYLQILSACAVAFAHGANDVANAIGPLGGVISALESGELVAKAALSQTWTLGILALGGLGIVVGLATWGWRVIETIGRKITELTPTRGFSAEFGAAITIIVASRSGLPISTTHTLVGAVLGVGFARGIGALNLRVVRDIVTSWLVTLPVGAGLAIVFYFLLKAIFLGT